MTCARNERLFACNSVLRAARDVTLQLHRAIDRYATSMVPLLGASYGPSCVQQAWREFTFERSTLFSENEAHSEIFFSWLFHSWSPTIEKGNQLVDSSLYGQSPTLAYLARKSPRLNPLLRRYLEACLESPLSFYEIVECYPGVGFRVREVLTGIDLEVIEDVASTSVKEGDIVFARIPRAEGIAIVDAISPVSLPSSFRARVSTSQEGAEPHMQLDLLLRKLYFEFLATIPGGSLP